MPSIRSQRRNNKPGEPRKTRRNGLMAYAPDDATLVLLWIAVVAGLAVLISLEAVRLFH
ncbi:MAG TPA: hypothetical protein VF960_11510 [Chloroflexota bacterium]